MVTVTIEIDDESEALIEERFGDVSAIVLDWCTRVISNKVAGYKTVKVTEDAARLALLDVEDKVRIMEDVETCISKKVPVLEPGDPERLMLKE